MSNRWKRILVPVLLTLALLIAPTAPFRGEAGILAAVAASRDPVRAPHGMIATTNRIASEIGVEILKRGGNAVDASIAVAFALAAVFPVDGNLGGGGFMLIRLSDGRTTAIDYRETAPLASTRDMYLDSGGNLIRGEGSSTVGYRAAGVPGTVAGMALALRKYGSGRLTWANLIEPARALASTGFPVSHLLERSLRSSTKLGLYADSRRIFQNDGKFYAEGDTLRQPELAATLRRLQRRGPREFYEGRTARLIAADMRRNGGLITLEDLRRYTAKERTPLGGTYRGFQIISMPPPSSGGAVLIEMLNMLEGYDVGGMGWNSSASLHLLTEVMRRAFADRAEYMGDTDFVGVPIQGLIEKSYAARLRETIDMERASKSTEIRAGSPTLTEPSETTHFTVIDAAGNVVANTYTLNDDYGSGVTARGTGVLLNNEMDDFTSKAGVPNEFGLIQSERNSIVPGKRPLSAMTPTFVLRRDGTLWFALGSPGGPRIINAVLQVIVNIIDHRMNLQQAVDAPRIHHQWLPDELYYEPYGLSADTERALRSRGHLLTLRPEYKGPTRQAFMGDVQGVMIEERSGVRLGASDPRRSDGLPAGY
ncbi:MAG TPA: gamma-glutamyltransferase [Pyrinomonadaceae bacterium]|jgi:gamma-glutamyltranspeptidase/glutathione hydrolase|nr:gamma-glutamyltransferase [Pyrinomonadaceae bacterium]